MEEEKANYYAFSVKQINNAWHFRPEEVVMGEKDGDWISVQLILEMEENTPFAYDNAY